MEKGTGTGTGTVQFASQRPGRVMDVMVYNGRVRVILGMAFYGSIRR